jgi:hypothetical protein
MQEIKNNGNVYLQRCVFYKVSSVNPYQILLTMKKRETAQESKEPRLQPEEDPGGKFYHIQDEWNVIQPLCLAELTVEVKSC